VIRLLRAFSSFIRNDDNARDSIEGLFSFPKYDIGE